MLRLSHAPSRPTQRTPGPFMMAVRRSSTTVLFLTVLYSSAAESKLEYDESPTLLELQRFPVKGRFEDIVAEIQNDYEHFGIQLLEDSKGVRIKGIERANRGIPVDITVEILSQWLLGKGRLPVTWRTFVECLRESGLNVPANYIEATLDRSTFLRPPDSHIPVSANSRLPENFASPLTWHFSTIGILVAIVIGILVMVVTMKHFKGPTPTKPDIQQDYQQGTKLPMQHTEPDYKPGKKPSKVRKPDKKKPHLPNPGQLTHVKLTVKNVEIDRSEKKPHSINESYQMRTERPHGICVIVNNKNFTSYEDRKGTDKDEKNLSKTFRYLGYDIEIYLNCDAWEIKGIFEKLQAERNFSNDDSLVCCILSHGQDGKVFGSDGIPVELDEITSLFAADQCPKLQGKPKLFFTQACRGKVPTKVKTNRDRGVRTDGMTSPAQADFFFGYPTAPGYEALREVDDGSWYISVLCEVFCEFATYASLDEMHRKVMRKVGEKESDTGAKEAPEGQDRLPKHLYFF